MGIIREIVQRDAAAWQLTLTASMLDQLEEYASLLLDWNTRMNLTAIKEPEGVACLLYTSESVARPPGARGTRQPGM